MSIIEGKSKNHVLFCEVRIGNYFKSRQANCYIKIDTHIGYKKKPCECNSVDLASGKLVHFSSRALVKLLPNAEVLLNES